MIKIIKDTIKMIMQHAVLPAVYRIACVTNRVDKKLVVFADAHNKSCPVYMRSLAAELKKRGYKVRGFFYDAPTLKLMCGFMKVYAKAGTVIISDNFLPVASCRKRKKTKVVQLWHGCGAYKKFGYDTEDDIPAYYKGNVYKNYDLVTVSSKHCEQFFETAMRAEKGVVRAVGVPATDVLMSSTWLEKAKRRFYEAYPEAAGKRIVLWAPTFRGRADEGSTCCSCGGCCKRASNDTGKKRFGACCNITPDESDEKYSDACNITPDATDNDMPGVEYIERLAKFNDVYLIRHDHPHKRKLESGYCDSCENKEKDSGVDASNRQSDIYTLIAAADLLITDYSSVCYDFALTGKPIIFFVPDYEEYSAKRGFYMDLEELAWPVVTDEERIVTEVAKVLATGRCEGCVTREAFLEKYMSACDGRATKRVADIIDDWNDK